MPHEENSVVLPTNDETTELKQTLYNLWKFYHLDVFFFVGAVVGRVSFKKFYELVDEYKLGKKNADAFFYLQLKRFDFEKLSNSDSCFSDDDVKKAIACLQRHTDDVKYLPFITRLKSLKKFFHTPQYVTPLGEMFVNAALKYHATIGISVSESFARDYFTKNFKITDADFDFQVFELFQAKTYDLNGERRIDLCDLAELEQIIYEEHYKPPMSDEERAFFLESIKKYPNLTCFF